MMTKTGWNKVNYERSIKMVLKRIHNAQLGTNYSLILVFTRSNVFINCNGNNKSYSTNFLNCNYNEPDLLMITLKSN